MTAKPIPGAGGWVLFARTPDGPRCTARLAGAEVDTQLMPDDDPRRYVLGARRTDWASSGHGLRIGLSIDRAKPLRLKAWSILNLVLVSMSGPARPQRLRNVKALDWSLPAGRFHADVSGLGVAFDAVKACQHLRRHKP